MARETLLVAAHVVGDLNVLVDISSRSLGYFKQWYCTNDSEFLSLINSKFPLPHQLSLQGFRHYLALITNVTSELGTRHLRWGSGINFGEYGKVLEVLACLLQTPRS